MRGRERRPHHVIELAHIRRPRRIRGRDEHLCQRQLPQKRISRLPRRTDQDPTLLRQPVVIPRKIRLRLSKCEVIVIGIAQIIGARVIRDPPREIDSVHRPALAARMFADRLVDGVVRLLGHGE